MILELHLIQNFAPSNLNRSDTGAPKDCIFGGFRRARISSQCFKRAMRQHFKENFAAQNNLAERTIRLVEAISKHMVAQGKDEADAKRVIETALSGIGLKMSSKDETKTEYMLFLGRDEIKRFADICLENYDALVAVAPQDTTGLSSKEAKKAAKKEFPSDISKSLKSVMEGGKASDLALFGRMLADLPDKNRDASSQVAHAISTHKTGIEFDFFTAVDDLKPDDTAASDHLGTIEFNSACFYRYLNVDTSQLQKNLQDDGELARATVEAFIRAAVEAVPTGKQNSFATHEKPSFVFAVVSESGKCTLANAFEKPVKASEWNETEKNNREGLVRNSVERLDKHWHQLTSVFGDDAREKAYVSVSDAELKNLNGARVENFEALIQKITNAIFVKREA